MVQLDWAIAISLWLVATAVIITNGYLGDSYVARLHGLYWAHVYKTAIAIAAVLVVSWLYAEQTQGAGWYEAALWVSAVWILLSMLFEFGVGHYILRHSWRKLLADYQFWRGRLGVFVLTAQATLPALMGWIVNRF